MRSSAADAETGDNASTVAMTPPKYRTIRTPPNTYEKAYQGILARGYALSPVAHDCAQPLQPSDMRAFHEFTSAGDRNI